MITTVVEVAGWRIYTGWIILAAAGLVFLIAVLGQILVMKRLNRRLREARLGNGQPLPVVVVTGEHAAEDAGPSTQALVQEGAAGDGTMVLDPNGTVLLEETVGQP